MDITPPFFAIAPENHAAWLVVVTITFLIYSIMGVTGKVVARLRRTSLSPLNLKAYDWTVLAALAFAIAQSVLIVNACQNGLGQHQDIVSDTNLDAVRKELFAASLLSVVVHVLGKLSTVLIIMAINARKDLHIACTAVFAIIAMWGVAAIFILSFRCGTESPWNSNEGRCLNNAQTFVGINTVNVLTDIALVVLPCIMMWTVQTTFAIKFRVIGLFASRIAVPALLIPSTAYYGSGSSLNNETWFLVEPLLLGQMALNTSILTACIPSLKGIIDMFWSGASVFTMPVQYTPSSQQGMVYGHRSKTSETLKDKKKNMSQDRSESQEELRHDSTPRTVDGDDGIRYR